MKLLKKIYLIFLVFAMIIPNVNLISFAENKLGGKTGNSSLFGVMPSYNVGDKIFFGTYPQCTTDYNIVEPIEWRILNIDGNKALIVSEYVLDNVSFNTGGGYDGWETVTLRTWLNDTSNDKSFYNKAFNVDEKSAILQETITMYDGTDSTTDNVFILDKPEVSSYFASAEDKKAKPTEYAMNVLNNGQTLYIINDFVRYWTRYTHQPYGSTADVVNHYGTSDAISKDNYRTGVRPALYIDLSSSYFQANVSNITWDLDGGQWLNGSTWSALTKYKEGYVLKLPNANNVSPQNDEYVFTGWSINNNNDNTMVIPATQTGNIKVKAMWRNINERDLTDREKNAFIVRNEWTTWVREFTDELQKLDKKATGRIYNFMDYYDMQYRFTEKYKKVPEYLDEDGKPTQKLKDMIKEKRKEVLGAKTKDYLKFTSKQNGSIVRYGASDLLKPEISIGYSYDGTSFVPWDGSAITLNNGEYIYVRNEKNRLSNEVNSFMFSIFGSVEASGDVTSMINFAPLSKYCFADLFMNSDGLIKAPKLDIMNLKDYCYWRMFAGCTNLTEAPDLPATTLAKGCYKDMFSYCTNLIKAPKLPATTLVPECYVNMFSNCVSLVEAPDLPATTLATQCYWGLFYNCSNLNKISIAYTGPMTGTSLPEYALFNWVYHVSNSGTFYYSGTYTDSDFDQSGIPKDSTNKWTVLPYLPIN